MKKLLLILVLVCVGQPALAQEMDVWQTKGGGSASFSGSEGSTRSARSGGNVFDSRVKSVSQALKRADVGTAPKIKVDSWLRGTINGSSDLSGDVLVVARGKHTELVDNRNPKKPVTKRLAQAYQGGAMGYAWVSPDGTVALVADDTKKHQIIELNTGRVIADGETSGARFVGQSTLYWWSEMGPLGRSIYHQNNRSTEAKREDDFFFFGSAPSQDYLPCELTRLDWRGGGGVQTITFSECDSILSVSEDGKSALLGNQGEVVSMPFLGGKIDQDVYGEIVRVDLGTMEREVVGHGRFLAPIASDDLTVVCSNDPDTMYASDDVIVSCYRNGRRIDHRFTPPEGGKVIWRSIGVSPDGKYFAIRLRTEQTSLIEPGKGLTYIQELGVESEPLLTISGVGSTTWLPGGRRLLFSTDHGPATLYDYKAGWKAVIGGSKDQHSGMILLGERDDRFLIGKERGSTRDMLLVTVGSESK